MRFICTLQQLVAAEACRLSAVPDEAAATVQRSFFDEFRAAPLSPLVLWSPGVVAEIAVDFAKPRVSLDWATPEVVVPWPLSLLRELP